MSLIWTTGIVGISNGFFWGVTSPDTKFIFIEEYSVRVCNPWNSWYFLTEILAIQVSPVLALRGVWGQWWRTILRGNIAAPFCWTLPNPENEPIPNVLNPKIKEKNENRLEDSENWSRFIVLKSKKGLIPLTKLSPFIIEKCIKVCGEIKNITTFRSGALLLKTHRTN